MDTNTHTDRIDRVDTTEMRFTGIQAEGQEMALQLINGNRDEVKDFICNHETPAQFVLVLVRHLISQSADHSDIGSIVNVQSLIEGIEV